MGLKYAPLIILLTICRVALVPAPELKADESIPIPKVTFDDKGNLVLQASPTSSASDFDSGGENERRTIERPAVRRSDASIVPQLDFL